MNLSSSIPIWKNAPFIRLLLPLIAGIILQWYQQFPVNIVLACLTSLTSAFILFLLLPLSFRFRLRWLQGCIMQLLLVVFGMWLTWQKDMRHHNNWYGNYYQEGDYLKLRIDEPFEEKNKSYKANTYVEAIIRNGRTISCTGKILTYFSKDGTLNIHYGDRIIIHKNLQAIKNSGNPGGFNYRRYAAFQQLFHNVFLKEHEWLQLDESRTTNHIRQFIFTAREYILSVLRNNIDAGKDESGIAEALLIGYTNDLDKDLVQAYSNTGVVHIIAVSGMHLGLIYIPLLWFFARVPGIKRSKFMQAILILICLWLFSFLTGAAASVLRSAVMFTFIILGKSFSRTASVYNSLAASAFFDALL
jgi:competence protein ComEC